MSLLRNFLTFKLITITPSGCWLLGAVWCLLVLAGLWSVKSRHISSMHKIGWAAAIICLPIVGLWLYSVACLWNSDWEVARRMGFLSPSKKKIIGSINAPDR